MCGGSNQKWPAITLDQIADEFIGERSFIHAMRQIGMLLLLVSIFHNMPNGECMRNCCGKQQQQQQ